MRTLVSLLLLCLLAISPTLAQETAQPPSSPASAVPDANQPTELSADLGSCSALISVRDAASQPIFNAKVTTRIHYGFLSTKKLDLETYTSARGQVKIVGLPEVPKKPIYFHISKGELVEIVQFDPSRRCRASFDVQLK